LLQLWDTAQSASILVSPSFFWVYPVFLVLEGDLQ